MDPVFQRLGDVTIQRLEKPKDKVGLQGNNDIMEKENKEERIEQNFQLNLEDSQGVKRNYENIPGPSSKRAKFDKMDFRRSLDFESSAQSFSDTELTDYDTDSEIESDEEINIMKSQNSNIESATSELETSTDFFEKFVQEPFEEQESELDVKPVDEIKVEADDYEYDIKEKLKEMGEISFETVKKGDKPKKPEMSTENEVVVTPAKKTCIGEEDPMSERLMSGNMRRNIREVMDETKLDESTLAAQRQEVERLRRVQEQQRIIREVQRQMAQERVISLLQGGNMAKAGTSSARIGNTVLVKLPNGQTKTMTKLTKKPFDLVKVPKNAIPPNKAKNLMSIKKPSSNLTPSVSIAPVMKRGSQYFPQSPSDTESESEDMPMMRPHAPRSKAKEPVTTIDISSDDDCIVVSESENDPADDGDEDPSNSGMHTNDEFNQPDEQGRVVVNIGHPEDEPDIYLAPQITQIIKPHQIGGIRFLFDNVIESIGRFETSTGFGCILAHSMGLGKTLQVVSFSDIFLRNTPAKTILCIMPINTLQNWLAEYNMWLPSKEVVANSPLNAHGEVRPRNFNLHVLNDSHKTLVARAKVINQWKNGGGVLLIGYEQFRLLSLRKHPKSRRKQVQLQEPVDDDKNKQLFDDVHEALVKPGPDLVICDEGHRIKNSHASISLALKQMRTKRRVVLTGYPLQNNLMEYWCMVDFVRPNYLGTKTEFCNMFERPIQNGQCIDSTGSDIKLMRYRAHVLHSLLVGFVQRRSHTVLQTALPQKEEYVLLVRMTDFQRTLYETFMNEVVRTQSVPNPLKAFAVCCKIWNHPDVLYYFLKKQAGGDAVDIDLEEVSSSTASNDVASKSKKGSKKTARKGKKPAGKPAASITPYNSSGDPSAKTTQKKTVASKKVIASTNPPNCNTQNVPPSNQCQPGFTHNMNANQNNPVNKLQDESTIQNNQSSGNIIPGVAHKVDYNSFCPSNQSATFQNPPSNYSDSGFSQQSVDYPQNNQRSAFSPTPSISSNPPSNVSQDSAFTNYSQANSNQRFPMNQPNFIQNQFSAISQTNAFPSPAPSHAKREELSNGNYPTEEFKNTPSTFQNHTGTFQDNPNQNFPINIPNSNFSTDSASYPANNQNTNFHSGNISSQTSGFHANCSQNTNYPPNHPNYPQTQASKVSTGNQNSNFSPGGSQNSNYPQNSHLTSNQNPNFNPNNHAYPPNNQGSNYVQNNQGTNTSSHPESSGFPAHTTQNTNFPSSGGMNFSSDGNNPSFASTQNAAFGETPSNISSSNPQSSNFGSNSHSNTFPQNQILPSSEQPADFRQITTGAFPSSDENFNQNRPITFNPQNQTNTFNQASFEHGFNQNNQTSSFSTNQATVSPSSQTQSSTTNFHNPAGNYSSNQQNNFPHNNYSNNDSNNFSAPVTPNIPPSPASNFQGNVGFPNNGPASNFASNNSGKSFSTTPTENAQNAQRGYGQNNIQPANSNQSQNFPHTPSHAFPPSGSSNYSPIANPSPNFPSNSNQSPDFAQTPNHSTGFPPQTSQSPGFPSNSNQSSGFTSNPNQSPGFPTNANQSSGFSSNPNQSPTFTPNPNQSPGLVPNNNQCNFPPTSSQAGSFSSSMNHPPNVENFQQNIHPGPNFTASTNQTVNGANGFSTNSNQQASFTTANSAQSSSGFAAPNAIVNQQQPICNFPTNQHNFPSNKSNQHGNEENNQQGNCPLTERHQSGNFAQSNQQSNFPQNQQNSYQPNHQQGNLTMQNNQQGNLPMQNSQQGNLPMQNNQQGNFALNNQQNFPNNPPQVNFNNNFAPNTNPLQGNFAQSSNQQTNFPTNSNTNTSNQNQTNQHFQSPPNFQAYQQSQALWGQDPNFKQPYNQNVTSNQTWIKKEDIKPIINSPIKLEGGSSGSESKPKINIISDIKLSSGGAFDMKKINILSDIKLDPKKEFEDIKEEMSEVKNVKQPEALPLSAQKQENGQEDFKAGSEIATPVKGPAKEDTGIPYDWAIELLKDYVPGMIENSAKMEILFCIIKESIALGDRLLVFSQSLITLDLIEQFLQMNLCPGETHNWAKNVNYYRLDGSTSALEREKLINEFNSNPKIYLFLVSTRAGSLGINLIGANRVVVLDASWNPCHDTQAVCRVYRYGQRKPCFVYRLVVDNCLEKKIYDRQINKQGMSDRVVDECNPDAHLTIKDVSTLCFDDGEEVEVKDWSHCKDNYIDVVLQKVLIQHGTRLNKEPFQHESLLVDRKDKQLSSQEKRLAKKGYEREKQAAIKQPAYGIGGIARGHRPVASVRPMQQGGERPTRWIPAEHWQRQGMTAQEMTLPLDVVIPTNQPDKGNIVLKAGQKVLVLKSPKGVYMQLESGKIVAIKTAIKVRGKAEEDASKVKPAIPSSIKNNTAISVLPQKRAVRPFTPNIAKLNMRSVKQNVPNLVSRIQSVTKRVQTAKAKPYQIGLEIAKAVNQTKSETESHASSSDEEGAHYQEKRHFNFVSKDSGLTIEPRTKGGDGSRSNSLERRDVIRNPEIEVEIPRKGASKVKNYKSKRAKNSTSALERLEQSTSTIMSESKQTFQETLDSITSTYPEEEKLSDTSSHASTTHSVNQSSQSISSTSDQEVIPVEDPPYQSEAEATPTVNTTETPKTDIPTPEYGYNNYYGYNHVQPYPMPPQGYPVYHQPPPYDMMGYPQQPQYNYGMYPPQNYPPQHQYSQGPFDYAQPPPQGPVYPGYHPAYPPQQYPPPPQGMYPPPGAPPPAGYRDYQYPPAPPHNAAPPPPPPAAAPYYPPGH